MGCSILLILHLFIILLKLGVPAFYVKEIVSLSSATDKLLSEESYLKPESPL
jgi:hypothetical protein